jgi:hypothetical protein
MPSRLPGFFAQLATGSEMAGFRRAPCHPRNKKAPWQVATALLNA